MKKKYSQWKRLSLFMLLMAFAFSAAAQERAVSGTVKDETGNAMPGVSVIIKGTANGTVTSETGEFRLNATSEQR